MSDPMDRETRPAPGTPQVWVQWKGSDICCDARCSCGGDWHIDGDFVYYVKCPNCGAMYHLNGHVELVRLTDAEAAQDHELVTGEPAAKHPEGPTLDQVLRELAAARSEIEQLREERDGER